MCVRVPVLPKHVVYIDGTNKICCCCGSTCISFIIDHNGMNVTKIEIIRPIWSEKHCEKTAGSARFRNGARVRTAL